MRRHMIMLALGLMGLAGAPAPALAPALAEGADSQAADRRFTADRVFDIEYAADPQLSPNGQTLVYVRRSMDRLKDLDLGRIWSIDTQSGAHRPLIQEPDGASMPRWSPDGSRLLYAASAAGRPELRVFEMATGRSHRLAQFLEAPAEPAWSPDGRHIAFTMFVPSSRPALATPPAAPEGATWSPPVRVFDRLQFRFDGAGYLRDGNRQVFILPAEGGTPRQVSAAAADLSGPAWLNNRTLLVSGNLAAGAELDPVESEIYAISLDDLSLRALTDRDGPDHSPVVSPDGSRIAYRGFDDRVVSYQQDNLYVMNADGSGAREIAPDFPGSIDQTAWAPDGRALLVLSEDHGVLSLFRIGLDGSAARLLTDIGGTSIGRPYAQGSFSLSGGPKPLIAYTAGFADRPAEIALARSDGKNIRILTGLNDDVLPHLDMARIEEIRVVSSHDGQEIEAWVALPPGFRADGSFPMILEIHGGPYAMYGPYFASEIQRFAAEGYVTVWANPRGSTGYGEAFAFAIDRAYPGHDHDDLMSVVDALIERNYVSPERLFVTGGSGGGILTAWIVTKTDRFAAAASVKPVINWMTMALAADISQMVRRHWIRADPWSNPQAFLERSPISYVDRVRTPTLMMVGDQDYRTPAWEAEQFYTGLKMNGVETALIHIPGAPHSIAARPSRLIAKTDNIMGWFARFDPARRTSEAGAE